MPSRAIERINFGKIKEPIAPPNLIELQTNSYKEFLQIGREGAGIFALTEHNNLQGVCDMGMLPNRFPGYTPVTDDAGRRAFEVLWGAPLPGKPVQGAEELLSQVEPEHLLVALVALGAVLADNVGNPLRG